MWAGGGQMEYVVGVGGEVLILQNILSCCSSMHGIVPRLQHAGGESILQKEINLDKRLQLTPPPRHISIL